MSVLGALVGATIETCEMIDYKVRVDLKFPDGYRHGVLASNLQEALEAHADWEWHRSGNYDKWFAQEIQRLETRKQTSPQPNDETSAGGAAHSQYDHEDGAGD